MFLMMSNTNWCYVKCSQMVCLFLMMNIYEQDKIDVLWMCETWWEWQLDANETHVLYVHYISLIMSFNVGMNVHKTKPKIQVQKNKTSCWNSAPVNRWQCICQQMNSASDASVDRWFSPVDRYTQKSISRKPSLPVFANLSASVDSSKSAVDRRSFLKI